MQGQNVYILATRRKVQIWWCDNLLKAEMLLVCNQIKFLSLLARTVIQNIISKSENHKLQLTLVSSTGNGTAVMQLTRCLLMVGRSWTRHNVACLDMLSAQHLSTQWPSQHLELVYTAISIVLCHFWVLTVNIVNSLP